MDPVENQRPQLPSPRCGSPEPRKCPDKSFVELYQQGVSDKKKTMALEIYWAIMKCLIDRNTIFDLKTSASSGKAKYDKEIILSDVFKYHGIDYYCFLDEFMQNPDILALGYAGTKITMSKPLSEKTLIIHFQFDV